jgi:hypothetical protein
MLPPPLPEPRRPPPHAGLVDTCSLTRAQALKASTKLSHIKPPTNPGVVHAFLTDTAALVVTPISLCADMEKTLSPIVAGLSGHGLSHTQITPLLSLGRIIFRCRPVACPSSAPRRTSFDYSSRAVQTREVSFKYSTLAVRNSTLAVRTKSPPKWST